MIIEYYVVVHEHPWGMVGGHWGKLRVTVGAAVGAVLPMFQIWGASCRREARLCAISAPPPFVFAVFTMFTVSI